MMIEEKITKDGSSTFYVPELNEHYHSVNGAIQESMHVFIKAGLEIFEKHHIKIFEMGFGTGLNALLTYNYCKSKNKSIDYTTIEKYPLQPDQYKKLNYFSTGNNVPNPVLLQMHEALWGEPQIITDFFNLKKVKTSLHSFIHPHTYDLVYFDAFAPSVQPDLWTPGVFANIYKSMNKNGILVTYSAKGQVRRNMTDAGFTVERIPGPPGKRQMMRATKTI